MSRTKAPPRGAEGGAAEARQAAVAAVAAVASAVAADTGVGGRASTRAAARTAMLHW